MSDDAKLTHDDMTFQPWPHEPNPLARELEWIRNKFNSSIVRLHGVKLLGRWSYGPGKDADVVGSLFRVDSWDPCCNRMDAQIWLCWSATGQFDFDEYDEPLRLPNAFECSVLMDLLSAMRPHLEQLDEEEYQVEAQRFLENPRDGTLLVEDLDQIRQLGRSMRRRVVNEDFAK